MTRRSFLAPEVIQSSAMDCGPAALGSMLAGFGLPVSYGRLREACQTDVDGTSIDTLEDIARALGLDAEQVVTPVDHVLRREADNLPAIAVVRRPNGLTHFVILWRTLAGFVQVMDPGAGRVWIPRAKLLDELFVHAMPIGAADWRAWAGGEDFAPVVRARLHELGCADDLLAQALADPSPRTLATLDAALRMVADLVGCGALAAGREADRALRALIDQALARADPREAEQSIPARYWSAGARAAPDDEEDEQVTLRGAVLVRVRDLRALEPGEQAPALPPDLAQARREVDPRPARTLLGLALREGALTPTLVVLAIVAASVGVLLEAAILRGLVELGRELELVRERMIAWAALAVFAALMLLLEGSLARALLGLGRRLELRLRVAFLSKVPQLGARYFQSRLSSDMAERIHAMHHLRRLPALASELMLATSSLLLTVVGIAWLDPGGAMFAGVGALVLLASSGLALPALFERDLRFRTHGGALARVVLDALIGLVPIRTHGAARALRREHEQLLVEWMRAGLDLVRAAVGIEAIQALVGTIVVVAIVARHSVAEGEVGAMLLLIYWALRLPTLGQRIAQLVRQYPSHRSRALRLLEPLGAPDEERAAGPGAHESDPGEPASEGVRIELAGVSVIAGGHSLLDGVDFEVAPGEHLAIVGRSGAGKSTLVSLLLGWHRPAAGELRVDGLPLDGSRIAALRRQTAWVDPAIALWNEALIDNLLYGAGSGAIERVGAGLRDADLLELVANLPEGLQTELGEGGGLLSGGEGQRVRLGRALLRAPVRLVVLDEPLRGLDRERRAALITRVRGLWPRATLLCVTHDIEETLEFPRVVVVEAGAIVQDGPPRELAACEGLYAAMLEREREVHEQLWRRADWRRIEIHEGRVREREAAP